MEINPDALPYQTVYKLLTGAVVPRAIGWISTINSLGQLNLAPFSFFTVACPNPPSILFCPQVRNTDGQLKDTLHNLQANSEFVVNIVTEALVEGMNISSTEFPAEINEFQAAGLTPTPSISVRPPRVAESPIHFECVVSHIISLSDQPGGGSVVIGRIRHIHVADEVLYGGDKIDPYRLQPVGRLAGNMYAHVRELFEVVRPPTQVKSKQ